MLCNILNRSCMLYCKSHHFYVTRCASVNMACFYLYLFHLSPNIPLMTACGSIEVVISCFRLVWLGSISRWRKEQHLCEVWRNEQWPAQMWRNSKDYSLNPCPWPLLSLICKPSLLQAAFFSNTLYMSILWKAITQTLQSTVQIFSIL